MLPSIAIVTAQFNELITQRLFDGALKALLKNGLKQDDLIVRNVPGALELPLACQWALEKTHIEGVIAIGAVIKGSTDHYTYVCNGCTNGIMSVQIKLNKPISFCVLTCDNLEQALDRVGGKLGNKGYEAAETLLHMIQCKKDY